jgi:phage terminase large subunit-like protein
MGSQTQSSTDWPKPQVSTLSLRKPPGAFYDADAAERAVSFFRVLKHSEGKWEGTPFELAPWQAEEVIKPLFGWKRANGTRLYRELYLEVPRKNGKTTLAAGIAGYATYADREPGARVYSAAVDRDQAGLVFSALSEMVAASTELEERSKVYRRSIFIPKTRATYKILSADAPNKHGLNASCVVIDELHAHQKRELYDVLATSTGSRAQPLIVSITTAGVYSPESVCWELHEKTRAVATEQYEDAAFLGVIYGADAEDDWKDPGTWAKANPNLGISLSEEYIRRECAKAEASVAYQNTFRQLHLNQWTQQLTRWIDLGLWDENAGSVVEPDLAGRACYAGLDLGSVSDLTAFVMVFPSSCGEHEACYQILPRFFIPEAALESGGQNANLYRQWVTQGYIRTTPGNATDYAFVRERIVKDAGTYRVENLNVDYLFQGAQLTSELMYEGLPVNAMRQGFMAFALPMQEFERLMLERKLHHGGNPVLRWMADNVVVRRDPAGNLKPDKEKSRAKIDGIVALVMALEPLTLEHYDPNEDRGLPYLDLETG